MISGAELAQEAEQNRIKILPLPAARGVIYDSSGKILARNTPQGREYSLKEAAAHLIGFVGEADQSELETFTVSLGSLIGKMGIEREEDKYLRGRDGGVIMETDSQGETVREMSRQEPISGRDLYLFLDHHLQQAAFSALDGKKGAVVAATPEGEVLALVSSPSFDPNLFTSQLEETKIGKVLNDPDQSMFNRVIGGQYPPGSVFKLVTAVAGLEIGVIKPREEIEDTGEIKVGEFRYGNWYFDQYGKKEGMVDMVKAIRRSNDIYFYRVGERLGVTKLAAWARAFGLGSLTKIPLKGETAGLVPDKEWKQAAKGESWYLGDTYITAIGQGDLQMTPIQVNQMTGVVAAGGKLCQPRLVNDKRGERCERLPIEKSTLDIVKEGMKQACQPGGTGWPLFQFQINNENYFRNASDSADIVRIPVACKTGTAEYGDPDDKTHAWFTAFAPVENPEIVVTILLEGAGGGADKAAPVAKDILEAWFEK